MSRDDEIIDGEIVGEYSGETLMNLPNVEEDEEPPQSRPSTSQQQAAPDPERRGFLRRLLIGGGAAILVGGGAAVLINGQLNREPQTIVLPNGSDISGDSAADLARLAERVQQLEAELIRVSAERDQAISDLDAVQRERDNLQVQLDECLQVVDLWEEHHRLGLDDIMATGLSAVGPLLRTVIAIAALFSPLLGSAFGAFTRFTGLIPGPQAGIEWLSTQVAKLNNLLNILQREVEEAIEENNTFTQMIAEFVLWVLDRLPFGAGAQARSGLEQMSTVVNTLPDLLDGISTDVLDPLATWFSEDREENLFGLLLEPVEDLFSPGEDLVDRVSELGSTFEADLEEPATAVLAQRSELHDQITTSTARLRSKLSA